jgi:hypothetical protein
VGQATKGAFALPAEDVTWRVLRDGVVVHSGTGHARTVAGAVMEPGSYELTFTATDGGKEADAKVSVVAEPRPADLPEVTILAPGAGAVHQTGTTIEFSGAAVDAAGEAIDGARFRWTASAEGKTTVLCAGSDVPRRIAGGGQSQQDCSSFTAVLQGQHLAGHTEYTITLRVWDAELRTDRATRSIRIYTPPTG